MDSLKRNGQLEFRPKTWVLRKAPRMQNAFAIALTVFLCACAARDSTPSVTADNIQASEELKQEGNLKTSQLLIVGERSYKFNCAACHGNNAKGIPNLTRALSHSKIVNGTSQKLVRFVLYNEPKLQHHPAWFRALLPVEAAGVLTYIRIIGGSENQDLIQPSEVISELASHGELLQR
jgi:mono/diheme cytochrome c family protein